MLSKLDKLRDSTWRLLLTAHIRLIDLIEGEFTRAGLPPLTWYDVLLTLEEAPGHKLRLHELADTVLLSRSNLTRLLDRLERAGLLCRESCPTDRRGAFAVLTAAGLEMREKMWPVYSGAIGQHFGHHLDSEEAEVLSAVFKRMLAAGEAAGMQRTSE